MANSNYSPLPASLLETTKPVLVDLLNRQLSPKELAEELNYRQIYMASGASWNAGRVSLFLAKHQLSTSANQ